MLLAAGATPPASVVATGSTRRAAGGGRVDWSVAAGLSGFGDRPALSATVLCTLDASTPEEVVYTGKKGTLRLHRPAHTPSRLTLSIAEGREASTDETLEFALPPVPAGATRHCAAPARQGYERRLVTGGAVDRRAPLQLPRLARLCVRGGRGQPGAARGQARGRGVDARGERHHAADRGPAAQLRRPGGRRQAGGAGQVVGPADVGLAGEAGGSHRVNWR